MMPRYKNVAIRGMGALLLAAGPLLGCVHTDTPEQAVFQAKADYEALLMLAVKYRNQPLCWPGASPLALGCSDSKVVALVRTADNAAEAVLDNAEATVRDGTATPAQKQQAVQAAQSSITSFGHVLTQYGAQ